MTTETTEQVRVAQWAYLVTPTANKDFWLPIGLAFPHKDGGFTIPLDRLGLSGKLVVRPPKPEESEI